MIVAESLGHTDTLLLSDLRDANGKEMIIKKECVFISAPFHKNVSA